MVRFGFSFRALNVRAISRTENEPMPLSMAMAGAEAEADAALKRLRESVCSELGAFLRSLRSSEAQRARREGAAGHASAEHELPATGETGAAEMPGHESEPNGHGDHRESLVDRGGPCLGPVEHEMVMALAERVWLAQG